MPTKDESSEKELEDKNQTSNKEESFNPKIPTEKTTKPKFKVEEKDADEAKPSVVEKPDIPKAKVPTISSFSQLDANTSSQTKPDISTPKPETDTIGAKVDSMDEKASPETAEENVPKEPALNSDKKNKGEISSDEIKDWLNEVRPEKPKGSKKEGSPFKVFLGIFLGLAVAGVLAGGIFYYRSTVSKDTNNQSQSETKENPTPEPTQEPTATPAEINLEELSINVLNGSGVAGEAGKVADLLVDAEFPEADTGNADNYDYTTTIVKLKEDTPSGVYDAIKEALGDDYILEKSESSLDNSSSYDVEITVGTKKES